MHRPDRQRFISGRAIQRLFFSSIPRASFRCYYEIRWQRYDRVARRVFLNPQRNGGGGEVSRGEEVNEEMHYSSLLLSSPLRPSFRRLLH